MMNAKVLSAVRPVLFPLLLLAGCGSDNKPMSVYVQPVKGTVTLASGKPQAGGLVSFVPAKEGAVEASGTIGSDGTYTLSTAGKPGAAAGSYKVRIEPDAETLKTGANKKTILPFDRKYSDETTSNLTAEVKEGPNDIPFQLK
jgi:hypothetical protein